MKKFTLNERNNLLKEFDSAIHGRNLKDDIKWLFAVKNNDEQVIFGMTLFTYNNLFKNLEMLPELNNSLEKFGSLIYKYIQKNSASLKIEKLSLDIIEQIIYIVNMLRSGGGYQSYVTDVINNISKLEEYFGET